ncbi:MAG: DUF4123 domain-containing protein [Gammaproteobacteria bacterium]
MIAPHITQWLTRLEQSCADADVPALHIIIDQARASRALLPSVVRVEPRLPWCYLFDGLPEPAALELAPLLVQVDLSQLMQRHWLLGLMQACDGRAQLLAPVSHWLFKALGEHLGRCLEARHGSVTGLLRYYDPRLFGLLFSHVLGPEQQAWLSPAVLWSWLDRDGQACFLPGAAEALGEPLRFEPVTLSDCQLDILSCASDVTRLMDELEAACPVEWSAEQRFQASYHAMLEARDAGEWQEAKRLAYTLERLRDA